MRQLLVLPILISVATVSGCTIPGTTFSIPIPGFSQTISLENDIVIIRELKAIPSEVTAPQPIRIIATVQNLGDSRFPQEYAAGSNVVHTIDPGGKVRVELFDYCQGLFKDEIQILCPDSASSGSKSCDFSELLPKETKEVSWLLTPKEETKLITPCDVKVAVTYPYRTSGLTTIHFIGWEEYNRQVASGTFTPETSTISLGQGPVKAWFEVKDQQPIPVNPETKGGSIPLVLHVENKGFGFPRKIGEAVVNPNKQQTINPNHQFMIVGSNIFTEFVRGDCSFSPLTSEKLIQRSRELPCNLKMQDVAKETTRQMTVDIDYLYEFRDEVKVTVNPKLSI